MSCLIVFVLISRWCLVECSLIRRSGRKSIDVALLCALTNCARGCVNQYQGHNSYMLCQMVIKFVDQYFVAGCQDLSLLVLCLVRILDYFSAIMTSIGVWALPQPIESGAVLS